MSCTAEGCQEVARIRGLCLRHYHLARRSGTLDVKRRGRACQVAGCPEPHYAKGYCSGHYDAWKRWGDPLKRVRGHRGDGHVDRFGYRWVSIDGRLVLEHRVIMEATLGRPLQPGERVTHLNGDRSDNRIENLSIATKGYISKKGHRVLSVKGKQVLEHRLVMERHLGRSLGANEQVLHRNGDPLDNRLENLLIRNTTPGSSDGYIYVYVAGRGNVAEHRWLMEGILGRPLTSDESVHHRNGDRQDNRAENLELWSRYQPYGQRVADKLKWAREIISRYGHLEHAASS